MHIRKRKSSSWYDIALLVHRYTRLVLFHDSLVSVHPSRNKHRESSIPNLYNSFVIFFSVYLFFRLNITYTYICFCINRNVTLLEKVDSSYTSVQTTFFQRFAHRRTLFRIRKYLRVSEYIYDLKGKPKRCTHFTIQIVLS